MGNLQTGLSRIPLAEAHPAACRVRFWVLEKVYKNPDGTFIGFMAFEVLTNERWYDRINKSPRELEKRLFPTREKEILKKCLTKRTRCDILDKLLSAAVGTTDQERRKLWKSSKNLLTKGERRDIIEKLSRTADRKITMVSWKLNNTKHEKPLKIQRIERSIEFRKSDKT